ncbi:MAG TPA: GAF domain-containing protein [Anaerolineae bacterium]|nr:GAF domain-containing protein [Anaerolineae bacterium]
MNESLIEFRDYILLLLGEFAGGPGPKENNLVRFGLAAILWAVLLAVTWSRQRQHELPREKLLVWGFGMGLARELFMFSHVSFQLLGWPTGENTHLSEPLEHALTMAAIVTVAGAFIRYILDDARLSRRYLQVGLSTTALLFAVTWYWWFVHVTANPDSRFNQTWGGTIFFIFTGLFAAVGLLSMARRRGWLRNVISIALGIFVLIAVLRVVNLTTSRESADIICRLCNGLHILTIPLFGYVYIREQSIEKKAAEDALAAYRDHLADLVTARTNALSQTNEQLQAEVAERKAAEESIIQRNAELAAQNAIAATVSRSLDLDLLLDTALDTALPVLDMDAGCIYLLDADPPALRLQTSRGRQVCDPMLQPGGWLAACEEVSRQAVETMQPVARPIAHAQCQVPEQACKTCRMHVVASAPLVSKDRAVGALSMCSRRADAMAPHELEILAAMGQQVGMAVENARLYKETGEWAEELALLHESSIHLTETLDESTIYQRLAEQSAKLLGCPVAAILLWDNERQQAVPVFSYGLAGGTDLPQLEPNGDDLVRALLATRHSIPIEDGQNDAYVPTSWRQLLGPRALLAVPLWGKDRPLAFLILVDERETRRWRPGEMVWVESFANPAAIALENAYLYSQIERAAVLEERQRIAAEMHDGLAQTLSYVMLKACYATDLLEAGQVNQVLAEHQTIREAVERASREVRLSIASLQQNPVPPQSLQALLAGAVGDLGTGTAPATTFASRIADSLFVSPHHAEQIVRIVQEALLNARRHAQANQIEVLLEKQGDHIAVTVVDDGQGFDPAAAAAAQGEHFGLHIMRARAARIAGQLDIISRPGGGTQVILKCSADLALEPSSQSGRSTSLHHSERGSKQ